MEDALCLGFPCLHRPGVHQDRDHLRRALRGLRHQILHHLDYLQASQHLRAHQDGCRQEKSQLKIRHVGLLENFFLQSPDGPMGHQKDRQNPPGAVPGLFLRGAVEFAGP